MIDQVYSGIKKLRTDMDQKVFCLPSQLEAFGVKVSTQTQEVVIDLRGDSEIPSTFNLSYDVWNVKPQLLF